MHAFVERLVHAPAALVDAAAKIFRTFVPNDHRAILPTRHCRLAVLPSRMFPGRELTTEHRQA